MNGRIYAKSKATAFMPLEPGIAFGPAAAEAHPNLQRQALKRGYPAGTGGNAAGRAVGTRKSDGGLVSVVTGFFSSLFSLGR